MIRGFSAWDSATFHTRMLSTSLMPFLVLACMAGSSVWLLLVSELLDFLHLPPVQGNAFEHS